MSAKIRLYASSHDLDARNINVVTFDGGYDMKRGQTIAEASDYKDMKRWVSCTVKSMERLHSNMSSLQIKSKVHELEKLL